MILQKEKSELEIINPEKLIFGSAPKPVKCGRDLLIGSGEVYPEINFTLPSMIIDENSIGEIRNIYNDIITDICSRAVELQVPGLVVEFELLPPMTLQPEWGGEITRILKSALRVTPVDIRDINRPPEMRSGELFETMMQSFEICAQAGADMLSIESTGGKEIHDEALVSGDLTGIIFSLGILAVRDIEFLWKNIVEISRKYNVIPAGDTACGFANTAMILADKKLIPKVLAAVIRTASIPRSLEAIKQGAIGPGKDCAYEGPFLKAITGVPISMEGRTSACAHLSHIGNIVNAYSDLWSNESVQNVQLLSASAPVVYLEQLAYDCRLMNTAIRSGSQSSNNLQKLFIESDAELDMQAYLFRPENVIKISGEIIKKNTPLEMTIRAADITLDIIKEAAEKKKLKFNSMEDRWLSLLSSQLQTISSDENELWSLLQHTYSDKIKPEHYLL